jgi:hypothetical protein
MGTDGLAASVADVQDRNRIALDGEKNTIHMRRAVSEATDSRNP